MYTPGLWEITDMRRYLKKLICLAVAVIIAASMMDTAVYAAESDSDSEIYYKGVYYRRPCFRKSGVIGDVTDSYLYSDSYFVHSSKEYDSRLAAMSMSVAMTSISNETLKAGGNGFSDNVHNVTAILEDIGFGDIVYNDDYVIEPTIDTAGVVCGHKKLIDEGREFTLIAAVPRSAGYGAEWGNNFIIGSGGDAAGFDCSADKLLDFVRSYISECELSGDIKLWIPGYSRGAAIANLAGKKLIDDARTALGERVALNAEDLFVYTFGTPSAADVSDDPRAEKYSGIFNTSFDCEIVSSMAPVDFGFDRCGTDRILSAGFRTDGFEYYMSVCDPVISDDYFGGESPEFFTPKRMIVSDGALILVEDEDSYIPRDAAEFLRGLSAYLSEVTGGRQNYSAVYERPLALASSYFTSLSQEKISSILDHVKNDNETIYLVMASYAYFMSLKTEIDLTPSFSQLSSLINVFKAISSQGDAGTGTDILTVTKLSAEIMSYLRMSPDKLRSKAGAYLSRVLKRAMTAVDADERTINELTDSACSEALVHFVSHLALGNIWQSDKAEPFDPDNEQIKNFATLAGNFYNFVNAHYDAVIMSAIMSDDGDLYDYTPLTESQNAGYRRVYLSADGAGFSGRITDGGGDVVGIIDGGVLVRSSDRWIGFTSTDDGGFLRIPNGESYTVTLSADGETVLTAEVCEYCISEAKSVTAFSGSADADTGCEIILELPELPADCGMPSAAEYTLSASPIGGHILGDADSDGEVTILDATAIQRELAGLPVGSFNEKAADADEDKEISILDATAIQRRLAELPANDRIGKRI